jgi:hypothetical protein
MEHWLRSLSNAHRSAVSNHEVRWKWLDVNPIRMGRQADGTSRGCALMRGCTRIFYRDSMVARRGFINRNRRSSLESWRPRRDLNPCYRRESGVLNVNSNKLQEHGRTGWRSKSSKKYLIVSPMCPTNFEDS